MATAQYNVQGGQLSLQKLDTESEGSPPAELMQETANHDQGPGMQTSWEHTVCEQLKVPDTYGHVAVLIVHWAKNLDEDLKCGKEVEELRGLFTKRYHFHSSVLTLDDTKRPQAQLDHAITGLIVNHDGPCRSTLLIIYYTGHATGVDGALDISAVRDPFKQAEGRVHAASASWNEATEHLKDAEADTLMILDTCFAGNIFKGVSQDVRTFEVLAAAGQNMPTPPPGEHSFTRALIKSLQGHLNKPNSGPLTTNDLKHEIWDKCGNTNAHVFPRYGKRTSERSIKLAPLSSLLPSPTRDTAHLTLRFAFQNTSNLELHDITLLARAVSQGVISTRLPISAIDWLGFKAIRSGTREAQLTRWRRAVRLMSASRNFSQTHGEKRERSVEPEDQGNSQKRQRQSSHSALGALSPSPSNRSELHSPQEVTSGHTCTTLCFLCADC